MIGKKKKGETNDWLKVFVVFCIFVLGVFVRGVIDDSHYKAVMDEGQKRHDIVMKQVAQFLNEMNYTITVFTRGECDNRYGCRTFDPEVTITKR